MLSTNTLESHAHRAVPWKFSTGNQKSRIGFIKSSICAGILVINYRRRSNDSGSLRHFRLCGCSLDPSLAKTAFDRSLPFAEQGVEWRLLRQAV
jgi:hypothetical protein